MEPDINPALNLAELQELYGDELLLALLCEFRNSLPGMVEAVATAVEAADAPALFQSAHRLKSAVANLYAEGPREAAARLEHMGRFEQLGEAEAALGELQTNLSHLLIAVDEAIADESGEDSATAK